MRPRLRARLRARRLLTGAILALTAACAADSAGPPSVSRLPEAPSLARTGGEAALLQGAAPNAIAGQYIVVVHDYVDAAALASERAITPLYTYAAGLHGFAAALDRRQLERLLKDARVKYIEQNRRLTISESARRSSSEALGAAGAPGAVTPQGTQTGAPWNLDRIDQGEPTTLDGKYHYTGTGAGVTVYVMSSGVRFTHNEFDGVSANRATLGKDFIVPSLSGRDCTGHGTYQAGVIAGSTTGVAKGAKIKSVRVIDCAFSTTTALLLAGINWITYFHVKPAVAAFPPLAFAFSQALNDAVGKSVLYGVTWVLPAGDTGSDACATSPASQPLAITVGSSQGNGALDIRLYSSNIGPCIDLFAPGEWILSSFNGSDADYTLAAGSFTAAAHVAGLAALFLQARPTSTPTEVEEVLISVAQPNVLNSDGQLGAGSPDLLAYKQNGECFGVGSCFSTEGSAWPVLGEDESYFSNPGEHRAWLRGTPGTNFNLKLWERIPGGAWVLKVNKSTSSTNETSSYTSTVFAEFRYTVESALGTGTFDLWIDRPRYP